jgi:hypothetical protein
MDESNAIEGDQSLVNSRLGRETSVKWRYVINVYREEDYYLLPLLKGIELAVRKAYLQVY